MANFVKLKETQLLACEQGEGRGEKKREERRKRGVCKITSIF